MGPSAEHFLHRELVALQSVARSQGQGAVADRAGACLELLSVALAQRGLRATATAVATELATRLRAERVSLGLVRRGQMRVVALSHSARFDPRANLARDLTAAMEEAADQDAVLTHPVVPGAALRITRAHEELATRHGGTAACTVPLAHRGAVIGALTLERSRGPAFDAEALSFCTGAAELLAPVLVLAQAAETRLLERGREALRGLFVRLREPGHPQTKASAGLVVLVVALLAWVPVRHRIIAEATLEGRVQRAIVAGLDGYVAEAHARAGDVVQEGQVLARLDERDLRLERRKTLGRREQLRKEHREALAGHDRVEVAILGAKIAQAEAQLELLEENLVRTQLVAPFDGVVVRGDLSQSLGAPVDKGAVLFEVAPLDGYRIILKVDDQDMAELVEGARGRLALAALPGRSLGLAVEQITPVATAEDGRNTFRVEAHLEEEPSQSLRPGMEGMAKIEVGRRSLLWIASHRLVDALRLAAWSWLP